MSSSPKLDITEINNDANPEIVTGLNSTVNLPVNPPVNSLPIAPPPRLNLFSGGESTLSEYYEDDENGCSTPSLLPFIQKQNFFKINCPVCGELLNGSKTGISGICICGFDAYLDQQSSAPLTRSNAIAPENAAEGGGNETKDEDDKENKKDMDEID